MASVSAPLRLGRACLPRLVHTSGSKCAAATLKASGNLVSAELSTQGHGQNLVIFVGEFANLIKGVQGTLKDTPRR